ncbi:MAG TPA: redoxin domain-containing protein [Polyangia bacterium]|nr:redoxin domain-containing protein [Polyangia bacterium]
MVRSALFLTWLFAAAGPDGRSIEEARPWLGVMLNDKQGQVGVENVFAGSPAEAAGIRVGDVVRRANGSALSHKEELIKAVLATGVGGTLKLHIAARAGGERDLAIKLGVRPDVRDMQRSQLLGRAAPDFAIKKATLASAPRLAGFKGQVVLLDFWASWCMPCIAALPHLEELHERLAKKGLRVIGVTSDDWGQIEKVVKHRGLTYPQVFDADEEISGLYMVTAIPTLVVIGRDGKVVEVSIGDSAAIDKALSDLFK